MSIIIQPTLWDDAYFDLRTGRIVLLEELTDQTIQELKEKSKSFDLVVIDNYDCNIKNDEVLSTLKKNYLRDIQICFKWGGGKVKEEKIPYITVQNNLSYSEQIIDISGSAYNHSRFKRDKFLNQKKSQAIYKKWCEDAFNNNNKYFIIYKENDKIDGYILFHREEHLVIELIAVRKGEQGKGIGSHMMNFLISYCKEKQIDTIKVGTQSNNMQAIGFYQKKGFLIERVHTLYHYWPNK